MKEVTEQNKNCEREMNLALNSRRYEWERQIPPPGFPPLHMPPLDIHHLDIDKCYNNSKFEESYYIPFNTLTATLPSMSGRKS